MMILKVFYECEFGDEQVRTLAVVFFFSSFRRSNNFYRINLKIVVGFN